MITFDIKAMPTKQHFTIFFHKDTKLLFEMGLMLSTATTSSISRTSDTPNVKEYVLEYWKSLFTPNLVSVAGISVDDFTDEEKEGMTDAHI